MHRLRDLREICPVEAITVNEKANVDAEACVDCGTCVEECPEQAISLKLIIKYKEVKSMPRKRKWNRTKRKRSPEQAGEWTGWRRPRKAWAATVQVQVREVSASARIAEQRSRIRQALPARR